MFNFSRIPGFYRLGLDSRREWVSQVRGIAKNRLALLDHGGLDLNAADAVIEHAIGTYALPMAIALHFSVNGTDRLVPMVVEEPGIVAAASHAAKMVRMGGGFAARVSSPVMIGQVQIVDIRDPAASMAAILNAKDNVLAEARALVPRLVESGGGPKDIEVRALDDPDHPHSHMIMVHIHVDCRDAMGNHLVNTVAEGLADTLAQLAHGRAAVRGLSVLADRRMVHVSATVPDAALDQHGGARIRSAIVAASRLAELDPYRAATHNKSIMNGIDAVLVATGNDWRSVEASAHAYAARTGTYQPLATWRDVDGVLEGEMHVPLALGTVGGISHVHPAVKLALQLMAVTSAAELAAIAAAVGLANNLATLRAQGADGIQRGRMALHARVIARAAGASGDMVEQVVRIICASGDINADHARYILERLRRADEGDPYTSKENT